MFLSAQDRAEYETIRSSRRTTRSCPRPNCYNPTTTKYTMNSESTRPETSQIDPKSHNSSSSNSRNQRQTQATKEIEISPGLVLPLCGANDTWHAVQDGTVTVTSCIACTAELFVIEDATFVLCPECQVVSPVDHSSLEEGAEEELAYQFRSPRHQSTVGLGVKAQDIVDSFHDSSSSQQTDFQSDEEYNEWIHAMTEATAEEACSLEFLAPNE